MSVLVAEEEQPPAATTGSDRLDAASFADVYRLHRQSVYRYLRARVRDEDEALDLTAITFERAFASRDRFRRRDGGVHAWLLRIARNAAIDASRRRRPTVDIAGPGADAFLGRAAVETDRVERERGAIVDLVSTLPGEQRDIILLRYAAGLTAKEIGVVVGKREGAVQKQIERGLIALREALHDDA